MRAPIVVSRRLEASRSISSAIILIDEIGAVRRELAEPRLRDHQFADPVHQFVEPLGLDAHGGDAAIVGPALLTAAPLRLGRGRRVLGHGRLDRRLRRHSGTSAARMSGNGCSATAGRAAFFEQRLERELHFVDDEHEDVVDRRLVAIRMQRDIPVQVAVFRLELVE